MLFSPLIDPHGSLPLSSPHLVRLLRRPALFDGCKQRRHVTSLGCCEDRLFWRRGVIVAHSHGRRQAVAGDGSPSERHRVYRDGCCVAPKCRADKDTDDPAAL